MSAVRASACELCEQAGGLPIADSGRWRVVRVEDAAFPAYYRVIWNRHVAEFSELGAEERVECMEVVARVEGVLREQLQPSKVNLASLGNMTPHLHWHVIARFDWDSHFPGPVWAGARRVADAAALARLGSALAGLDGAVRAAVAPA